LESLAPIDQHQLIFINQLLEMLYAFDQAESVAFPCDQMIVIFLSYLTGGNFNFKIGSGYL
jgi:hypothetical protein